MSELKRPASVRELLECLPRQTLVYLCELRGLPVSRANDDCRSSIARSFRGRRDEFLASLRKPELALLLFYPIRDGEELFELPEPDGYTKRELLDLATLGFGRTRELGRPFRPCTSADSEAPRAVRDDEASDTEAVAGAPAAGEAAKGDDPLLGPDSMRSLTSASGSGWSHPRAIRGLLTNLGFAPTTELTQDDFGRFIEALENRGYEIATVAGERLTPLHDALGIEAEVRLRHDALAVPATSMQGRSPSIAVGALNKVAELGDYARASLRLELLTAGFGDDASPGLLASCVESAAAGLPIDAALRTLLERVGQRLLRIRRDPVEILSSLVQRIDREDGEVLLREYVSLHRPGDELAGLLSEHWAALTESEATTRTLATDRVDASFATASAREG